MQVRRTFGWVLLVVGVFVLMYPFISGFSGYFFAKSVLALPLGTTPEAQLLHIIVGIAFASIGWILARPKTEAAVEK